MDNLLNTLKNKIKQLSDETTALVHEREEINRRKIWIDSRLNHLVGAIEEFDKLLKEKQADEISNPDRPKVHGSTEKSCRTESTDEGCVQDEENCGCGRQGACSVRKD